MVRCLALFTLLLAAPAMAADEAPPQSAQAKGGTAHAEATVTIVRGEEIRPSPRLDKHVAPPDRQERALPNAQIRIDFY